MQKPGLLTLESKVPNSPITPGPQAVTQIAAYAEEWNIGLPHSPRVSLDDGLGRELDTIIRTVLTTQRAQYIDVVRMNSIVAELQEIAFDEAGQIAESVIGENVAA